MDATTGTNERDTNERDTNERGSNERGMTTAEYTVGTLGACSVAAILIKLAQTQWFGDIIKDLLSNISGIAGF